jgi:hypothetical protein
MRVDNVILELLKHDVVDFRIPYLNYQIITKPMIYILRNYIIDYIFDFRNDGVRLKQDFDSGNSDFIKDVKVYKLNSFIMIYGWVFLFLSPFIGVYILFYYLLKHVLVSSYLIIEFQNEHC